MKNKEHIQNSKILRHLFILLLLVPVFIFHAEPLQALNVDFYDNWGYGQPNYADDLYVGAIGSGYDKISWIEQFCPLSGYDSSTQFMVMGVYGNNYEVGAYCVNTDRNSDTDYDFCIIKNSTWASNCSSGLFPVTPWTDTYTSSTWAYADEIDLFTDTPICDGEAGNTMVDSVKHIKRATIQYFCKSPSNSTCHNCGSSSDDTTGDYYYIDQMRTSCPSDGGNSFDISGRYATNSYVLIDTVLCFAYGTGKVCDTDHQYTTSTDINTLPTNPCKLADGYACTSSNDCWHNHACSGATTTYNGMCNGDIIDLDTNPYTNACGGTGILGTITTETRSCQYGGYATGYKCDPTLSSPERSTKSAVYSDLCKAGEGNACTITSDCYTGLECVSGFCMYNALAIYTVNVTNSTNSIYKGDTLQFDPQLSMSSDNNIQYSCWNYNGINNKCYGNSTQCTSQCNGATYSGSNWITKYIKTFSNSGTFPVTLTVGSVGKYSDNYTESFCVSGGSTYCWSCYDTLQNDDENATDWGGHCGTPYFLFCNNNQLNTQTQETSIDYGGYCGSCDNTSILTDTDLQLLISAREITYPFNSTQCATSQAIQGGIIFIVLLISAFLIIPVLFFFTILFIVSLFSGTTFIQLLFIVYKKIRDGNKKTGNNDKK